MGNSNLTGSEPVPEKPSGHDTRSLGPSDTSDSGSDLAGLPEQHDRDPNLPVDVAIDPERDYPDSAFETLEPGADSDAGGTGERRSASGDAAVDEAPDISPDQVIDKPPGAASP